jgi:peptidoglycan glycosyltransferase/penicillin-binding protein 2
VAGIGYRIKKDGYEGKKLNVKLTIDYHIQKIVESVMEKNNITGAVVVEDVLNGDILAISSKPDFKQNDVGSYLSSPRNELFNRAVASYNIGSIFKIISAAKALESGFSLGGDYFCSGAVTLGNRDFRCSSFERGGHGMIDYNNAFALSCNTYFIELGLKIGEKILLTRPGSLDSEV